MKVFFLVSRIPWPLEKGDKLRAYHQAKHLATGHEVFLCCIAERRPHPQAMEELKKVAAHVHFIPLSAPLIGLRMFRALVDDKPFQVHYFFQQHAYRKVKKLIADFAPDHIYAQLVRSTEYVKHLHHIPKTLDYMDALSAGQQRRSVGASWLVRLFARTEALRLRNYENLIFEYFDHHAIISAQDRDLIYHPKRSRIEIVPNGVDSEFFCETPMEKNFDIVFTGNMSYPPNVDCAKFLAHEVLPIMSARRPGTTLHIAGANPSRNVSALASPSVHVGGWMDDIRQAYAGAKVFAAPMFMGTGLQNKLLEAMSMNLPCVTSPLAAQALGVRHNEHVLIGNTAGEISDHILQILGDENFAARLAGSGQAFVRSHFVWHETVARLAQLMKS